MRRAGLVAAVALAALPGAAPAASNPTPRFGGTIVIGVGRAEPSTLNAFAPGFNAWAAQAYVAVLSGPYRVAGDSTYRPWLVTHAAVKVRPFTVTYHIRPQARWSDGRSISASDFVFTWQTNSRAGGYAEIVRARILGDKRVRFTFRRPYAAWRDLFYPILPRHALDGADVRSVWQSDLDNPKTGQKIASGPFRLASWRRGHSMTFVRSERYFGKRPYLRSVVFRFYGDFETAIDALRRREVDLVSVQPQPALAALRGTPGLRVRTDVLGCCEQLQFNLGHGAGGNALLRRRFVREAIARAVNREGVVRTVYGEIAPGLRVGQSAILSRRSPYYRPWWAKYRYEPAAARRLLERNGCRRGGDGIYLCAGRRVSFRLATDAGNQLREHAQQVIQQGLRRAGIELVPDNAPQQVLFNQKIPSGDYDIAMFSLGASTPALAGWHANFGCRTARDGQANDHGYCSREVSRLLTAVDVELSYSRQAAHVNRALAIMARDLPILPLFQRPAMIGQRSVVHGVAPGGGHPGGLLYEVERWWKSAP